MLPAENDIKQKLDEMQKQSMDLLNLELEKRQSKRFNYICGSIFLLGIIINIIFLVKN